MIKWYHEGKFPVDKFVKFFKVSVDVSMYPHVGITGSDYPQVDDMKNALHEMHSGETIKPVLLF
jgi:hypothetical protein